MSFRPAYPVKSIITSARSAGPSISEPPSVTGLNGTFNGRLTGFGRKRPSVPTCKQLNGARPVTARGLYGWFIGGIVSESRVMPSVLHRAIGEHSVAEELRDDCG